MRARWIPFPPVPSCLPKHGRVPPLRDALIVFLELSGFGIHRSNLLKLDGNLPYNSMFGSFSRACWLALAPPTLLGLGADIVMESITLF